jgi:hypothetical protein
MGAALHGNSNRAHTKMATATHTAGMHKRHTRKTLAWLAIAQLDVGPRYMHCSVLKQSSKCKNSSVPLEDPPRPPNPCTRAGTTTHPHTPEPHNGSHVQALLMPLLPLLLRQRGKLTPLHAILLLVLHGGRQKARRNSLQGDAGGGGGMVTCFQAGDSGLG